MGYRLCSLTKHATFATLNFQKLAVCNEMVLQSLDSTHFLLIAEHKWALFKQISLTCACKMLHSITVLKLLFTSMADKLDIIERLNGKPGNLASGLKYLPTVRTVLVLAQPLFNASCAEEFLTFLALRWLRLRAITLHGRHHIKANLTLKIRFKWLFDCLFGHDGWHETKLFFLGLDRFVYLLLDF